MGEQELLREYPLHAILRSGDASCGQQPVLSERKLRLLGCAICRQLGHLLTDERALPALEVEERFADGAATAEEVERAAFAPRPIPWVSPDSPVLAAHRAGIRRVIIPERNVKDLLDVPDQARREMEIIPVKRMDELLGLALTELPEALRGVLEAKGEPVPGNVPQIMPPPKAPPESQNVV